MEVSQESASGSPGCCTAAEVFFRIRVVSSLIATCESCRQAYEESRKIVRLFQKYGQINEDTQALIDKAGLREKDKGAAKIFRLSQITIRIASIAAAIIICLGVGWAFLVTNADDVQPIVQESTPQNQAIIPKITVTENGIALPVSEPITTDSQIRKFLINNRHQLVMNRHTALSIDPLVNHDKVGCLVDLEFGKIYVEVEHDGNPFVVETDHGRAVITGTAFDISAQDQSTTLIVSEGSVRFESDKGGAVQVTDGKQSVIAKNGIPSQPAQCQAEQLMVWATGEKKPAKDNPLSGQEFNSLINELPLAVSYPGQPIDLESLEYDQWVEEKRDWFKGQFPWIFQILKELESSNQQPETKLDYPELLIKTGDIWQIVYPERMYRVIPVMNVDALQSITREYGIDRTGVIGGVTSVGQSYRKQPELAFGLAALEKWYAELRTLQRTCDSEVEAETIGEHSYAMGQYLENTRILLWLCVRNGRYKIEPAYKAAMCDHLKRQIALASACKRAVMDMTRCDTTEGAVSTKHYNKCVEVTAKIIECEKAIRELIYNLRSGTLMLP